MTKAALDKLEELIRLIVQDETFDPNHKTVGFSREIERLKLELLKKINHE